MSIFGHSRLVWAIKFVFLFLLSVVYSRANGKYLEIEDKYQFLWVIFPVFL